MNHGTDRSSTAGADGTSRNFTYKSSPKVQALFSYHTP